jgi:hypothetical protein
MGIQEVLTYVGPANTGSFQRGVTNGKSLQDDGHAPEGERATVSGQAKVLFEAGQNRKFDAIRERVRLGYYMKRDVVDQVVKAMAREIGEENLA